MLEIGQYHKMKVDKLEAHGVYLSNLAGDRVLLPTRYVPAGTGLDDEIRVFIYKDSESRPIATTLVPSTVLNGFALMKARMVNEHGAFMDWGIAKDLLVPLSEQDRLIEVGKSYLTYVGYDAETDRLYGSTKLSKYLENGNIDLEKDEEVDLLIWTKTDLGTKVVINEKYLGLLFESEVFQHIKTGDRLKGYIKLLRPDKKIDVSLRRAGYENISPQIDRILQVLKENKGILKLGDKSDPEAIEHLLGMSKKTFKKAIGTLYKKRVIKIEPERIRLL